MVSSRWCCGSSLPVSGFIRIDYCDVGPFAVLSSKCNICCIPNSSNITLFVDEKIHKPGGRNSEK